MSHLNLPQFTPESSVGDVSYRRDADSHRSGVQRPDTSAVTTHEGMARSSMFPSKIARLPLAPGNTPVPDAGSASPAPDTSGQSRGQTALLSRGSIAAAKLNSKGAQHAQQAGFDLPATAAFKLPPASGPVSPQQTSRLNTHSKSWQVYGTAGTARQPSSPNSNNVAAKSWQQALAGASSHEQWLMGRHLTHGRMSEAGGEEEWGELTVRLPKQASSAAEKLVQQLPGGLVETAQNCKITKVCTFDIE